MSKIIKFIKFWLNVAIFTIISSILALSPVQPAHQAQAASFLDYFIIGPNLIFNVTNKNIAAKPETFQPKIVRTVVTAYSSTPDQTDDDPHVTASGKLVRDGIIAANFLDFGTKVKIPSLFGDKVFIVEDRMARRHAYKIDVWFPNRQKALKFGIKETDIIIVES